MDTFFIKKIVYLDVFFLLIFKQNKPHNVERKVISSMKQVRRGPVAMPGKGSRVPVAWKDAVLHQKGESPEDLQGVGPWRWATTDGGRVIKKEKER